ncbi:hypothetical protein L4D09_22485 [Photobacterium makurazakiensis]|uniref:hypothetical protein n=1 Tax=Photobacterium makurazakiensis TaxID=2910234 RepID=UPI003D0C6B00
MKKQVLTVAVAAVFGASLSLSAFASENAAEETLIWAGTIPGGFIGSDIALGSPTGDSIQQGQLNANEDGTFSSTIVPVRAFALKDDNGEQVLDPDTWYPDAVNWWVRNSAVTHNGVDGSGGYDADNLQFQLNGKDVALDEQVNTEAGSPDMLVSVSYTQAPTGTVTPNDAISVRATLFAEGDAGLPIPPAS